MAVQGAQGTNDTNDAARQAELQEAYQDARADKARLDSQLTGDVNAVEGAVEAEEGFKVVKQGDLEREITTTQQSAERARLNAEREKQYFDGAMRRFVQENLSECEKVNKHNLKAIVIAMAKLWMTENGFDVGAISTEQFESFAQQGVRPNEEALWNATKAVDDAEARVDLVKNQLDRLIEDMAPYYEAKVQEKEEAHSETQEESIATEQNVAKLKAEIERLRAQTRTV